MVKSSLILSLIFFLTVITLKAQYHLVYLKDKNNSSFSVDNPQEFLSQKAIERREKQKINLSARDLPVSKLYIEQITAQGAKVIYQSKWLNAVLVDANEATHEKIKQLEFVYGEKDLSFARKDNGKGRYKVGKSFKNNVENYGNSLNQNHMIGIDAMHEDGVHGEGIRIAVLDAGFFKANELPVFDTLFKSDKVVSTFDFVRKESSVYEDNAHGMQVLSAMAGYLPGSLIGGAYKSEYLLLKTEDSGRESKLEEVFWLLGAEYADSAGADILASSLGYNTFDNPDDNYSINQLDGGTAIITKAADYAAGTGMLVVVSVGNEGNDSWGKLTFPSDADSVLAVGAVNANQQYANFSSRGNTADRRIKPDVTAMGVGTVLASSQGGIATSNGTSFSSPQVAALAAGLWQTFPELNNMQIIDLIRKSSDRFLQPDSLYGYGIPNYSVAKQIQINGIEDFAKFDPVVYPNPMHNSPVTIVDTSFKAGDEVDVILFDTSIKKIYSKSIKSENGSVVINDARLDSLDVGTYILKISSGKKNVTRKLIKK